MLYVVTCVANPLRCASRLALARLAVADWLRQPDVHITLVECAHGSRAFDRYLRARAEDVNSIN